MANIYNNTTSLQEILETLSNKVVGAEVVLQEKTVSPSDEALIVVADDGYDGLSKVTVNGDTNLSSENIKSGVSIFGVEGDFNGVDTSDATATADHILSGKTAYVDGTKITGNIATASTISRDGCVPEFDDSTGNVTQHQIYYTLSSGDNPMYVPSQTVMEFAASATEFGDATANDVVAGKTFTSTAGVKVEGTATLATIEYDSDTQTLTITTS